MEEPTSRQTIALVHRAQLVTDFRAAAGIEDAFSLPDILTPELTSPLLEAEHWLAVTCLTKAKPRSR